MKIVVFEVEDWEQDTFDALKADHEIEFAAEKLSAFGIQHARGNSTNSGHDGGKHRRVCSGGKTKRRDRRLSCHR